MSRSKFDSVSNLPFMLHNSNGSIPSPEITGMVFQRISVVSAIIGEGRRRPHYDGRLYRYPSWRTRGYVQSTIGALWTELIPIPPTKLRHNPEYWNSPNHTNVPQPSSRLVSWRPLQDRLLRHFGRQENRKLILPPSLWLIRSIELEELRRRTNNQSTTTCIGNRLEYAIVVVWGFASRDVPSTHDT